MSVIIYDYLGFTCSQNHKREFTDEVYREVRVLKFCILKQLLMGFFPRIIEIDFFLIYKKKILSYILKKMKKIEFIIFFKEFETSKM